MDKASDFESEDCEFESRRGRYFVFSTWRYIISQCKLAKYLFSSACNAGDWSSQHFQQHHHRFEELIQIENLATQAHLTVES